MGETVKQCWPVTCVDLYHCEAVGRFIVDQDIGHDMESLSASARKGLCLQASRPLVPIGKRLFDGNANAVELVRVVTRSANGVLHQEIIHCNAVPHGVNASVDNVPALQVNGPGNSVDKTRR